MKHDLKVSSNRQPQQNNNSTKAQQHQQQLQQQSCYNNLNSGINNNTFSTPHQQQHLSADGNYHRNNHQYTSCTPSMHCPVHIQNPQHDGEFSRRIPSIDQVRKHKFLYHFIGKLMTFYSQGNFLFPKFVKSFHHLSFMEIPSIGNFISSHASHEFVRNPQLND